MTTRFRLFAVMLCALAQGVWIGASWHAVVHIHADHCAVCDHNHAAHAEDGDHDEAQPEIDSESQHSDCPTCQLATAAPDVPILLVPKITPQYVNFVSPVAQTEFVLPAVWILPFGQAPPLV